jgi:DNA-directed RNA polymerase sigma subunit (sigma70/sigma32)
VARQRNAVYVYAVRTQQDVADELGITRARVMQLEQSGLAKLRKALGAEDAAPELRICGRPKRGGRR